MFQPFSFERFAASGTLITAMSEMKDGSMSPRYSQDPDAWARNRDQFFGRCWQDFPTTHPLLMAHNGIAMKAPFDLALAEGDRDIHVVYESPWPMGDRGRGMVRVDTEVPSEAIVLTSPGAFACLTIADCAAIVLFDENRHIAALAHGSRVTALSRLPSRLVRFLERELQVRPADLYAAISPMIAADSYAFPPEMLDGLMGREVDAWRREKIVTRAGELDHVDLTRALVNDLVSAGLYPEQIDVADVDTASARDPKTGQFRFFSHHRFAHPERFPERESDEGRNMFIVGMPALRT